MRLTEDEFDREEKRRRKEVQRVDGALRRVQKARTADAEAAQRGERLAAVRASARTILEKANEHPDLVRPWLQRHVRLYVRKGYGDNRITVEWV